MQFSPERLHHHRVAKHVSRETLALAIGRSYYSVAGYETGRFVPSLRAFIAIAEALKVDLGDLVSPAGSSRG